MDLTSLIGEFKLKEGSETKIDNLDLTSLMDEFEFKEGSRTKIDKSLDLIFIIKLFLCLSVYISVRLELRSFEKSLRRDGRS